MSDQQIDLKNIDPQTRWTDIELLPAWDEEYYDVYQAKKFGKWVMLKTLKPQYRDDQKYKAMIEKEFDVRYNLSHPNIVMINDFEDVPGLGRCIITDDVYGDSLRKLLDENKLSDKHYEQLITRLPMAMEYIQQNHIAHHPIRPETIIFTEDIGNLKLIDVGFDQKRSLSHEDTSDDIVNFGKIMLEVLEKTGRHDANTHRIAERARRNDFTDVQALQMALSGRSNQKLYIIIITILAILTIVLAWMTANAA
jgi:serine/threonine protein kinase